MTVAELTSKLSQVNQNLKIFIDCEGKPPGYVLELDFLKQETVSPVTPPSKDFKDYKKAQGQLGIVLRAY